jgi:hypothetical protein
MTTPRGEVCKLLNRLSDDSSLKDIQYHGRDLPNNAATLAGVCLEAVVSLAHMAKRGCLYGSRTAPEFHREPLF